jgi:hypothetical protein
MDKEVTSEVFDLEDAPTKAHAEWAREYTDEDPESDEARMYKFAFFEGARAIQSMLRKSLAEAQA